MADDTNVHDEAEVRARLARDLPGWAAADDGIRRRYETSGWKATLMVVNAIGYLAEVAWHHPDIAASYGAVEVFLTSHDAGGVTDRDLALARRIEDVVAWSPGDDDGPLTGAPDSAVILKRDD